MLKYFNPMSGRTNTVCTTVGIRAKSFLLPVSQKLEWEAESKLPHTPSWSGVTRATSAFRGSSWLFQEENGSVRSGTTWTAIPGLYFKEENRWATNGFSLVRDKPLARSWSPAWEKGNKRRSSQGHAEQGTPPCSPWQGESQPKWNSSRGWRVQPPSSVWKVTDA